MNQQESYMKSTYKIIWSDEALQGLKKTIDYLEQRWTQKEIKKFAKLLDKQLNIIQQNPQIFPISNKSKGIRKSVLSKQTTIYYKINSNKIFLLTLFDNRQDPNKLNF
jgi:plasmid stabilization system protein ParE